MILPIVIVGYIIVAVFVAMGYSTYHDYDLSDAQVARSILYTLFWPICLAFMIILIPLWIYMLIYTAFFDKEAQ